MKKKKIIFSSSGDGRTTRFLLSLIEKFGNDDIEYIAEQIASACLKRTINVSAEVADGMLTLNSNSAEGVTSNSDTLILNGDNILANDAILYIN